MMIIAKKPQATTKKEIQNEQLHHFLHSAQWHVCMNDAKWMITQEVK